MGFLTVRRLEAEVGVGGQLARPASSEASLLSLQMRLHCVPMWPPLRVSGARPPDLVSLPCVLILKGLPCKHTHDPRSEGSHFNTHVSQEHSSARGMCS